MIKKKAKQLKGRSSSESAALPCMRKGKTQPTYSDCSDGVDLGSINGLTGFKAMILSGIWMYPENQKQNRTRSLPR